MTDDELLTTAPVDAVLAVRSEGDGRSLDVRLMRWGEVGRTSDGPERFARGAFRGTDPRSVTLEAIGPHGAEPGVRLVGRGELLEDREDGAYATFRVSRVAAGDDLLELVRDGVYRRASIVFAPLQSRAVEGGVVERQRVNLVRVGIVERGAYSTAEVVAVRSLGGPAMTEPTPVPTPVPPVPDPKPEPEPGARITVLSRSADNGAALDALRDDMLRRMTALELRGGAGAPEVSPLARFASLGAYMSAAYDDQSLAPLLARTLADQLTTDSPGVNQPGWLMQVAGITAATRPSVAALGGARALPREGMALNWPYLDPTTDLDALIAVQAAQKTEINSVKVKLLTGVANIATFAGGSDVSYQLIRRSSPSYVDAYERILNIAYNRETEAAFETALAAGATGAVVIAATATADAVRAALFAASAAVQDATGAPASVDLVSPTEWLRLGGLAGVWPAAYGTQNVAGTAQASTLRINISGLEVVRAPYLTGNVHLITNEIAAGWYEDGPFPISAEDVAKLGRDIAIWGMGTTAVQVPKGIVKSTLT